MDDLDDIEREVRPLFAQEARSRLARMSELLRLMEADPDSSAAAEGLYLEAHTIKGTSGMVGLEQVSRIAAGLEDLFRETREGRRTIDAEAAESLLGAIERMGQIIEEAVASGQEDEAKASAAQHIIQQANDSPARAK